MDCLNQSQQVGTLSSAVFSDCPHQQVGVPPDCTRGAFMVMAAAMLSLDLSRVHQVSSAGSQALSLCTAPAAGADVAEPVLNACAASAAAIEHHWPCVFVQISHCQCV